MSLLYFTLAIIIVFTISYITYKLVITKMDHIRIKQEKRLIELSESEAGRIILENEHVFRNERYKKIIPLIFIGSILCYTILLITGFGGIYILIHEILKLNNNENIFHLKNVYFILSPIIIFYSFYQIMQTIKSYKGRKF